MFGFFVKEEIAKKRMAICEQCENFIKEGARCSVCSCFMEYKTRMATVECPQGKWGKEECPQN